MLINDMTLLYIIAHFLSNYTFHNNTKRVLKYKIRDYMKEHLIVHGSLCLIIGVIAFFNNLFLWGFIASTLITLIHLSINFGMKKLWSYQSKHLQRNAVLHLLSQMLHLFSIFFVSNLVFAKTFLYFEFNTTLLKWTIVLLFLFSVLKVTWESIKTAMSRSGFLA